MKNKKVQGYKKVDFKESLAKFYPKIAKEWHPTKNGNLKPFEVAPHCRLKVWWLCPYKHDYPAGIGERTRKKPTGCSVCDGKRVSPETCIVNLYPELIKEWDWKKNNKINLDPYQLTKGDHHKAWWICKYCEKSYDSVIYNRTVGSKGCKDCGNKRGVKKRIKKIIKNIGSLFEVYPEISKEWHPTKNGNLKPKNVSYGSNKKVFWKCKFGHVWDTSITNRTGKAKTGCPYCTKRVSQGEVRIYSELLNFFNKIELHARIENLEVDILIKKLGLAIELDGYPWHKGRENRDISKNINLEKLGLKVFRLRDRELKKIKCNYSTFKANNVCIGDVKNILIFILKNYKLSKNFLKKINRYINYQENFLSQKLYEKILKTFPGSIKGKSLADTNPELIEEWDFNKNFPLTPNDFTKGSHRSVHWICKRNKDHKWPAIIKDRAGSKSQCPTCSRNDLKGSGHTNYDNTNFKFIDLNGKIFLGTKHEFHKKFKVNRSSVTKLTSGKSKTLKGWKIYK